MAQPSTHMLHNDGYLTLASLLNLVVRYMYLPTNEINRFIHVTCHPYGTNTF